VWVLDGLPLLQVLAEENHRLRALLATEARRDHHTGLPDLVPVRPEAHLR
jgi:mRNA degradation ribonuclease J1/J2